MNPGGLLEPCSSTVVRTRPKFTLPDRGSFQFPAPYGTTGIRLTNASDTGGNDALCYCGYSYWPNINAHVGQPELYVFLGVDRNRGGAGPSLWSVDKATDEVTPHGRLFLPDDPLSWSTGEGWYWSRRQPTILYCTDLTHLYRLDVHTGERETVVDVAARFPGKVLWQWHTADDDKTHSATLKDGTTYAIEGVVVYREGAADPWTVIRPDGDIDECQIDKSGGWLLIKVDIDGRHGEDNVCVNLSTGNSWTLLDEDGAAGHSDNGFGYMVAADNWNTLPGALRLWMLEKASPPQGQLVYHTPSWDAEMTHVSHVNAVGASPTNQYCVGSGASRAQAPRNNEVCGFRLDGSLEVLVVAPVLTDLDAPGGGPNDYDKLPKGNLDVTGEYFLWTTNLGGPRLDALLVKVPAHLLVPQVPPSGPVWTVTAPGGATRRFVEVP